MSTEDIRERIANVAKQDQQPKDRLWAAVFVLVILVIIVGAITVVTSRSLRSYLEDGRELADQRGAVNCVQTFIDNEWVELDYGLPAYCRLPQVFVHYPPAFCTQSLPLEPDCGSKWDDGS